MKFLADIEVEQGSDATFVDNAKAFFGTGNDLQIYHDGSNSYIDQTGTGKIILNTSFTGINVQSGTGESRFTKLGINSEIKIDDSGQVNRVVLKSNGDSYFIGGDVGVGTTGIDSILHIKDTGKLASLTIESDANMVGAVSFISPTSTDGIITMNSDGDFRISNSANTGFLLTGDTAPLLGLGVNNNTPTQQLHLNDNIRVEGAYYDSTGASGSPGSNGQVLSSTVTGTAWVAAGGGGGGIGGTISSTQVAFGATTGDEIDGVSTFTYSDSGSIETLSLGDTINGQQTNFNLRHPNVGLTQARYSLFAGTNLRGYLQSSGSTGEVTLLSNANLVLSSGAKVTIDGGSTSDIVIASASGSKVGIGNTNPASKLSVNGGVQIADDNAGLNIAAKAGTLRYREDVNIGTPKASNTFIQMYMRTEDSTYEWVNIVTNNW